MRDIQAIQHTTYDLIIIGGGINGAAVARDAALRGLKTILIEKGDFGGGTTSWSSRLVHGGLRYLEYFEFNLVRESLREREILLRTAPHLTKPLKMTVPIYSYGSRPYWKIQAGMLLYDILSFDKTLLNHRMLSSQQLRQHFRSINPEDLKGSAEYYDCQAEYAERLCLENILAAQAAGAEALNYVAVTQIQRQGNRIAAITCEDALTGEVFEINQVDQAMVINTSGPWVDQVCGLGRMDHRPAPLSSQRKIGGTKGSHIVVDSFPGAPSSALYIEAKADNRPLFILPWLNMYLIGTTDFRYDGDLDKVKANDAEVDYLIAETNRIIPTACITRQDVKFTYSGVRPLPYAEGKKAGSITRDHILYDHTKEGVANLISLIGGKLTTHRQVGEEMVDAIYQRKGQSAPPCPTRTQFLPGAILPNDLRVSQAFLDYRDRIPQASIHHLFSLYGAKASALLALVDESADLAQPIAPSLPDIKAQIVYAIRSEMAHTLVDICRRRLTLSMQGNYGFDALPAITDVLMRYCGWTRAECDRQIKAYRTYMETNCIPDYALKSLQSEPELQSVGASS